MTAIYAVWNNYGFALASDSNQTATQTDQTWVDPVEKIILLHNHQVAVAAAGSAMHEDIEINEIIRSWESQLPTAGFQKLDDYFIDFSLWFAGQQFNFSDTDVDDVGDFAKAQFEIFRVDYSEQLMQNDAQFFLDAFLGDALISRNSLNIYGRSWSAFADKEEINSENASDMTAEKIKCVEILYEQLSNAIETRQTTPNSNLNLHINQHPDFEYEIMPRVLKEFSIVFGRNFDLANELDQAMLSLIFGLIENRLVFAPKIKILMVGYGKSDWLPTGITFEMAESFYNVPRIKVSDYSNPNFNWYVALAVDSAVYQLTRGHSEERHKEIVDMAQKHIMKGHRDEFNSDLRAIADNQFRESVRRLEFLTLERLEFVSRLFVQIEALKSYLDEPVQGVGGDTKVISMTKTTRKERVFKELG
jgi:hypothetical protein